MITTAPNPSVTIVLARPEHIPQAVRVLADAFMTEGFTTHMFDLSTEARQERFRRAQILFAARKYDKGQPILLALHQDEPVGIAMLKTPGEQTGSLWGEVRAMLPHLPLLLGLLTQVRWRRLRSALRAMQPPKVLGEDHITLEGLAVAPSHQGQGIGRLLLEAVHDMAEQATDAREIYLYTADERNRIIYERSGYRVIATVKSDSSFTVYHMVRPLHEQPPAGKGEPIVSR